MRVQACVSKSDIFKNAFAWRRACVILGPVFVAVWNTMDQETAQPRCPHRRAKSERSSLETTFYCYLQCFRPKMPCEENGPKRAKSSQAAFAQNAIHIHRNRCRRLFLRIGPSVGTPATSTHSTCNSEPGTWNLELGTCSLEFGTWNLELGTWNLELGAWNFEPGTWNLELGTCSLEFAAWNTFDHVLKIY